ncbi:PEP-CTERM sorting domain-containing protein [Planctomyces sp. SH-PL62]|uniref:PEP-CTERM sorting domain-containing protein n=1 Tax=Planctomyces sp. SH-PL62 TaxID=1636152 RepID=UPI00078B2EB7|nr:PEP-CTERM sorting domain-containing protein [Planctomyces sp. SH-PL62]AMV37481.1 hypothetical protein VT85_08600 [Planctomyces sp. SH-PL62]
MILRSLRIGFLPLIALSLITSTGPPTRAAQVAATRASNTGYKISLFGINGKVLQNATGVNLAQYYSKISDSSQNGYNSAYGATGAGSGEFRTFNIDIRESLTSKFDYATVSNTSASALGDDHGGFLTPEYDRDMGKVGWLLANFSAGLVGGAGWTGTILGTLSEIQRAAALQAAVLAGGYGVNSFLIGGGTGLENLHVQLAVNALLDAAQGKSALAGFIDYRPQGNGSTAGFRNQDQAFAVPGSSVAAVPEPSTFAIAGLGALAFMGYGLRRRQAPAPTA